MKKPDESTTESPWYEIVWPLGKLVSQTVTPTPPITDLSGKTVCEVWDGMFRGDEMFAIIRQKLKERFPNIKFVDYTVFGNTHGPDEIAVVQALPQKLGDHKCDLVISSVGA